MCYRHDNENSMGGRWHLGLGNCERKGPSLDPLQPCCAQKVGQWAILHLTPSYLYLTHLNICEGFALAWTCRHHCGSKAFNIIPESCLNICNNNVYHCTNRTSLVFSWPTWRDELFCLTQEERKHYDAYLLRNRICVNSVLWQILLSQRQARKLVNDILSLDNNS